MSDNIAKKKVLKDTIKYAPSNIILRFSQIIQGLLVANILGPAGFG